MLGGKPVRFSELLRQALVVQGSDVRMACVVGIMVCYLLGEVRPSCVGPLSHTKGVPTQGILR